MRTLILFSLFAFISHLGIGASFQPPALTKTVEKEFEVDGEARIEVLNSFGEVRIASWDEPRVWVKVEISTTSDRESRAQQMLDDINIDFSQSNYRLLMKTDIDINTKGDEKFEVNYEVKVPDPNKLKIGNSFGDVVVDDRREEVEIDLAYGDVKTGRLSGGGEIRIAFGSGHIAMLREGTLSLQHAEHFIVEEATTMELSQEYSEIEIVQVRELDMSGRFGAITIGSADVIEGELQFTGFNLETLSGALKVDCKHTSDFTVDNVLSSFSLIDIDGYFGSYDIDLEDGLSADFEGKFQYSELRSQGVDIDFSRKITEKNEREYRARIGKGDESKVIRIYSAHGDLRLTQ
ncbi:MAG: hypothetical protein AAGA85_04775 [Bacteroidota bacterium]